MAVKKKRKNKDFWGYVVVVFLIVLAVSFIFSVFSSTAPPPPPQMLIVQKNPLPNNWGAMDFAHHRSPQEKKDAAVAVVYNEMLSRIETLLNIPTTLPHGTVVIDSANYLKQVYGSAEAVPIDVYRIGCLKIYNERNNLISLYKGKSKIFELTLYQVIDEYYYQGKPPASITISSIEDYHRAHRKKPSR